MGVGKDFAPCNIILTIAVEKSSCSWNIGLSWAKWGTKGPLICNSGSLGKVKVDFSGGMGTGMNNGSSYMLLTQENATVEYLIILRPLGPRPLGPLTLGPWGSTCAKWFLRMGEIVIIWPGYRY